jgi:CHAT domain-containing protein/tetratricopeptide (TPR) repeat protein
MKPPHSDQPMPPEDQNIPFSQLMSTTDSDWFNLFEHQLATLRASGRSYETAALRMNLLRDALSSARNDDKAAPETLATLQHEFAIACLEHLSTDRSQQIEAAIVACEVALQTYTLIRYPRPYADVQISLGNAYRERIVGIPRDSREQAMQCYQNALQVYTREDVPVKYAQIQYGLAQTYQVRIAGDAQDNLEQSIARCHEVLHIYTPETFLLEHAQTLLVLGKSYLQRIAGERRENLEQAITYYRRVADILTPEYAPVEYALSQHSLATAFSQRIAGERRENLEQAITCYHRSLQIYTVETFPVEYARVQNNLGIVYWQRTMGERSDNLERAIDCYHHAGQIFTLSTFPYQSAMLQNNLGVVYVVRAEGNRSDNLEQAIACYRRALQVWTLESFPLQYGKLQNNLGEVYQLRLAGERSDNLEQAIAYYHEALQIFTPKTFPIEYAMTQQNLGTVYKNRLLGEREENLSNVLVCYHNALDVYTLNAFPREHREIQLDCAETLALREDWAAVHDAYVSAHKAEDLLVALSTGAIGLDMILKEGRDATVRDGFALVRLGRIDEAAMTIERGRARGLAQAMEINTTDPTSISNPERRSRYIAAHHVFIEAQATLHAPFPHNLDDDSQRQIMLERTAHYREAKIAFDTIIEEIHAAKDPANFFANVLDATTIVQIVEDCGAGHALVYLAATPWGGIAVAVLPNLKQTQSTSLFAALDLPSLTDELVNGLVETRLADDANGITGGFYCAQSGSTFELLQTFSGSTFREKASTLHEKCIAQKHKGTLDDAAQFVLSLSMLAFLVDHPLNALSDRNHSLLTETLCHAVLQRELQRCQTFLSKNVIEPLEAWLRSMGISSLTIVPCGPLALLPLGGILLQDGHALSEILPTSIAPSTRALLQDERRITPREGIYALGNPYPTRQELRWSEAEAFTLALLGNHSGRSEGVKVQWEATRAWLIDVLRKGYVVDASCHGIFDTHDFLRSRLLLANAETLTLADMLSYQADLRGLRLFILSACQTAILDLQGAHNEIRSLAVGMLQAGAAAVLATLWAVDDRATYILMVRFAQEWFPHLYDEPPAVALARAQQWLRKVTNRELQTWQALLSLPSHASNEDKENLVVYEDHPINEQKISEQEAHMDNQLVVVRGRSNRFDAAQAQELVQDRAEMQEAPDLTPYADPYYWAGFQIIGW